MGAGEVWPGEFIQEIEISGAFVQLWCVFIWGSGNSGSEFAALS